MKQDELKYHYKYPHPAMTADCVIFGFDGTNLKVLLIERGLEPYFGSWALPGGFMKIDETIEQCAARELAEETGLTHIFLEQFKVFSSVKRDPRERVVTVVFIALVRPELYEVVAGDDASDARWFDIEFLPPMAFDHAEIIAQAREHLTEILKTKPIAFELLNKTFSLNDLQNVYEAITGKNFDRRNFHRKALNSGLLKEVTKLTDEAPTMCCQSIDKPVRSDKKSKPIISTAADESVPDACRLHAPSRPGRPGKIFTLIKNKLQKKDEPYDDEASIKDLFNY